MRQIGLVAAALTLLLLGAAPDERPKVQTLPGFPEIQYSASILEPPGADGKPLLKILRVSYDPDRKIIFWVLELQADIGFDEKMAIDKAWYTLGVNNGPAAYFFDREHVAMYLRDIKLSGKLYEGHKGDRIRMILVPDRGFPDAAFMEVRRP